MLQIIFVLFSILIHRKSITFILLLHETIIACLGQLRKVALTYIICFSLDAGA